MKKRNSNVLADGEVTGHYHVATVIDGKKIPEVWETDNNILELKAEEGAIITHEEHKHIEIPQGNYIIGIVQEYDHFAEEAKNVKD